MKRLRSATFGLCALACAAPALAGETTADSGAFALAAETCVAALAPDTVPADVVAAAGWQEAGSNPIGKRYTREDTSLSIVTSSMMGAPACVVDGYLEKEDRDGLDEAIEARLAARYTDRLTVNREGPGTGFVVGDVLAILSFENRSGGLSTRITAMSMADAQ